MPELAALFFLGSFLSALTAVLFTYFQLNIYKNKNYLCLQDNLVKINKRWNELEGRMEDLSVGGEQIKTELQHRLNSEIKKAKTTYFIFGFISAFFSWFGFFFLMLLWFSIKKLIKNKLSEKLQSGPMSQEALLKDEVLRQWNEIKALGFDS